MFIRSAQEALRRWRDRRRLLQSGLFDAAWYKSTHPDLPQAIDPAGHFIAVGASEGRKPHPLFDTPWYLQKYPDVAGSGANPLLHYLLSGGPEGRDPNPYFSSTWYLTAYPEVAQSGANPLAHYIAHGAREGRRPSPRFDPRFYLRQVSDDAGIREAPLSHFLTVGRADGLRPIAQEINFEGEPVEWARIEARKAWTASSENEVALLVAHTPDGRLKPHVAHYVKALRFENIDVILVVAADVPYIDDIPINDLAGLYLRENIGYDFAAWAHVLKILPRLWDLPALYLINDSVVGPVSAASFAQTLRRIRAAKSDILALTESREKGWHLQSYFLSLKSSALLNPRFQGFFNAVRNLKDKQAVIDRYEVLFAGEAVEAGLKVEAIYAVGAEVNPTLYGWEGLLSEGFPFIKGSVLTGRHDDVDAGNWREALYKFGFDVALAEGLLTAPVAIAPRAGPPIIPAPWRPEKIAFYGPWNYANGLGEASRGYLSALWRLDASLNLHGLKAPFHIHRRVNPGYDVRNFFDAADVAIVHLNPDGLHLLTDEQRRDINRARLRIGVWVWEMDHVPDFFLPNLNAVDVIWTPSQYCADTFSAVTTRPVHVIPHVVPTLPKLLRPSLLQRTILYAFDGSSYLARKNPTALVEAFSRSGLQGRNWNLVLKTKNLAENPHEAKALEDLCAATPGVRLIDQALTREEMTRLFEAADIYASPHASEGFGLTIAEAMAAGKIVVATDFSGSRDFLDASCGFPVALDIVTLTTDHGHYRKGGRWAQVRVQAFADALVEAADLLERGDHILGDRARARIAERLSADAVANAMKASLAQLAPVVSRIEKGDRDD